MTMNFLCGCPWLPAPPTDPSLQLEAFNHQPQTLGLILFLEGEPRGLLDSSRGAEGSWATFSVLIKYPLNWFSTRSQGSRPHGAPVSASSSSDSLSRNRDLPLSVGHICPLRLEGQGCPFPSTFLTAVILHVKFILCGLFYTIFQIIMTTFMEFLFFSTIEANDSCLPCPCAL